MDLQVALKIPCRLKSAGLSGFGKEPPVTNCTQWFQGCLDYIWVSREAFQVSHWLGMPYDNDAPDDPADVHFGPIPDSLWPSDHLAVGCRVQLAP